MSNQHLFQLLIIALTLFAKTISGISVENYYEKIYYGLDENKLSSVSLMEELNELKSDIKQLKQQLSEVKDKEVKDSAIFDIRYDTFPERCQRLGIPTNCAQATSCTKRSGFYHIKINQYSNDTFLVECDAYTDGGDWTIVQRRQDGSVDFYRTWSEYKVGFGDIENEFFIGLDKLHALTNYDGPQELMILMENGTNSKTAYATYNAFMIGNESEKYILKRTGRYTGTAGDSLKRHIGYKFTTKDQHNDVYSENCAKLYLGAWWYDKCHASNLNGHYGDVAYAKGITWLSFTGYYNSLQYVQMMVRRRRK